jgi:cbb3-type cytochrome oxidase maturation protein
MSPLYFIVPVTFVLVALGFASFIWTVKNGQYKDMEDSARRILTDEDGPMPRDFDDQAGEATD